MLWGAYLSAKRMGVTPAEAYFLDSQQDPLASWCFNRVVMGFGAEVEADLDKIEAKKGQSTKSLEVKRQRRLEKWLGLAPRFRDPAK